MKQPNKLKKPKQPWFAPRQVYLRTGQESSYVELSTGLQVSVAIGFGLFALWLLSASYSAVMYALDDGSSAALTAELESSRAELASITEEAAKVEPLEQALSEAREAVSRAQQIDETAALSAELSQTRSQLETLRQDLSKAKAEEATLQALLEAQATQGEAVDSQLAEEAASLHAQLEEAFGQIQGLEQSRDEADARVAALTAEVAERDENVERSETLLKAATEEIERLQGVMVDSSNSDDQRTVALEEEVASLKTDLTDEKASKETLQLDIERLTVALEENQEVVTALEDERTTNETLRERIDSLSGDLEAASTELAAKQQVTAELNDQRAANETLQEKVETLSAELDLRGQVTAELDEAKGSNDELLQRIDILSAELEAKQQVAAELDDQRAANETLQQRIDSLSAELDLKRADQSELAAFNAEADATRHAQAISAELREAELLATIDQLRAERDEAGADDYRKDNEELRAKLALAEVEIERMVRNTLALADRNDDAAALPNIAAAAAPEREADPEEIRRLKTELASAKSDIIKLKSDVGTAKKRLAEQVEGQTRSTSKPDNTAKLEQQLASTRSRMQQLNKALADAKLREVAIDLALINVVPSPSPRAPR